MFILKFIIFFIIIYNSFSVSTNYNLISKKNTKKHIFYKTEEKNRNFDLLQICNNLNKLLINKNQNLEIILIGGSGRVGLQALSFLDKNLVNYRKIKINSLILNKKNKDKLSDYKDFFLNKKKLQLKDVNFIYLKDLKAILEKNEGKIFLILSFSPSQEVAISNIKNISKFIKKGSNVYFVGLEGYFPVEAKLKEKEINKFKKINITDGNNGFIQFFNKEIKAIEFLNDNRSLSSVEMIDERKKTSENDNKLGLNTFTFLISDKFNIERKILDNLRREMKEIKRDSFSTDYKIKDSVDGVNISILSKRYYPIVSNKRILNTKGELHLVYPNGFKVSFFHDFGRSDEILRNIAKDLISEAFQDILNLENEK